MQYLVANSRPEHVVLVDTAADLPFPYPSSAQLVPVATFVQQDITGLELKSFGCGFGYANLGDR